MRILSDVESWCTNAAIELGDPSLPVGQLFARFVTRDERTDSSIRAMWSRNKLLVELAHGEWIPLTIDADGPHANGDDGSLEAFGVEQICPGFWTLTPSLNVPGLIHVFVHLFDVPTPAPWESLIVLPATMRL